MYHTDEWTSQSPCVLDVGNPTGPFHTVHTPRRVRGDFKPPRGWNTAATRLHAAVSNGRLFHGQYLRKDGRSVLYAAVSHFLIWSTELGGSYCTWPCWGWPAGQSGTAAASWCPPGPASWLLGPGSEMDRHPVSYHLLEAQECPGEAASVHSRHLHLISRFL